MEDRCVACGAVVPEGRQVCPACEAGATPVINRKHAEVFELDNFMTRLENAGILKGWSKFINGE